MKKKTDQHRDVLVSTRRLKALMNALPVGITFSTDTTCEYITGNPYLLRQLEMIDGDNISVDALDHNVAGKKLRHFINGRQITGAEMPMQRAMVENRQVGPIEIEVELPSGRRWLMDAIGAPIYDERGKVVASVAVNIDLTHRKKAESAHRLERLIEEEKQKIEFIADATHELRTPLAIIKGNVDLALRAGTFDSKSIEETLRAIDTEVVHLDKLLADLTLLTTKGDHSQRKVGSDKIEIRTLISGLVKRHEVFAKRKHIQIHVEKIPKVVLEGDERYLERLFSNIIANAILYGHKDGSVWISGKTMSNQLQIDIRDDGVGISSDDIPHVFDRFYRTERSRSEATGGTGLGLAIVKWIAESHGGSVSVTSTENVGSTFVVTLSFHS